MEYDRSLLFRKYPDNKEGTYVRTIFLTFNEVIERYRRQIGEGALRNWRSMRVGTDSARYLVLSLDREQVVTKEGRTAALPFRSQERFRYYVWTTDGYSGTRRYHRDCCDRECSRPLPNEFHGVLAFRGLESALCRHESL